MVKVARKKAAPRPKPRQKKKSQTRPRSVVPVDLSKSPYALARLDPWNPLAKGAKVPDFDNNPSCSGDFTYEVTFTTDATGRISAVIPGWPSCTFKAGPWNNAASRFELTGTSQALSQQGAFFSGWDECVGLRIVGMGMTVKSPLNNTSVTGEVVVAPMSIAEMKGWTSQTTTAGMGESDFYQRKGADKYELNQLIAAEKKYRGSILDSTCFNYYEPGVDSLSTAIGNGSFGNYLGYAIVVIGAPVSAIALKATVVVHYEWLPGKTYNWMATKPEPAHTGLLERVNNIAEQTPKVMDSIGSIASNVYSAVTTGLKIAGTIGLL